MTLLRLFFLRIKKNTRKPSNPRIEANHLVDSLLSPARCFHIIDSLSDIVHEEMAPHVARWGHPTSVFTYVKDLDQMRAFVNERGEYAGKHLAGYCTCFKTVYSNTNVSILFSFSVFQESIMDLPLPIFTFLMIIPGPY